MKKYILTASSLILLCVLLVSCYEVAAKTSGSDRDITSAAMTEAPDQPATEPPQTSISSPEASDAPKTVEAPITESETTAALAKKKEIAVIIGVRESITVYEDDSKYTVNAALLEGVASEGGDDPEVKVKLPSAGALVPGNYTVIYYCDDPDVKQVTAELKVLPADNTPPVIIGAEDKIAVIGESISYRKGISVIDNGDGGARLSVDASRVDLNKIGTYSVIYTATDKRGNTSSVTVKVTVISKPENSVSDSSVCTSAEFDALCQKIISQIIKPGMSDRDMASAIYDRVNSIKYVNTKVGDDDWVTAAYIGLTTGRGDCQNYAAASKALLTAAGIPNYDMERSGGKTRHYWNLVFVEGGWYHFDACPTLKSDPMKIFLLTDEEAEAYTNSCTAIPNYLTYDRDRCPYEVVKRREK